MFLAFLSGAGTHKRFGTLPQRAEQGIAQAEPRTVAGVVHAPRIGLQLLELTGGGAAEQRPTALIGPIPAFIRQCPLLGTGSTNPGPVLHALEEAFKRDR